MKRCIVCGCQIYDTSQSSQYKGRCRSCYISKVASDTGTTYGKIVAKHYEKEMQAHSDADAVYQKKLEEYEKLKKKTLARIDSEKRTNELRCALCDSEFTPIREEQIYCCRECHDMAHKLKYPRGRVALNLIEKEESI